jgi:hypothetical protein
MSSGNLFDELGRAFVEPVPRRGVLRLAGVYLMQAVLPPRDCE